MALHEKKPQKYCPDASGRWVLWPVDGAVTDDQRLEWSVSLAPAKARETAMSAKAKPAATTA